MSNDATQTQTITSSDPSGDTTVDAAGERAIPLPPGPLRLDVRNPHGAVETIGRARPDVLVTWTKAGDPTTAAWKQASLRIDVAGDAIVVAPDFGHPGGAGLGDVSSVVSAVLGAIGVDFGSWNDRVRFDLRVEVPAHLPDASIAARTASGRVHLSGIAAATISAHAASGTVAVEGCDGDLELNGASGRIAVARCSSRVSANTASGAIEVLATRPLHLSTNTASGAIRLRLDAGATGEARCNTASGAVTVEAAASLGVAVSFRSASGRVTAEPPFAADGRRGWRSGDGQTYQIKARTASGALRLRRLDTAAASAPTIATTPPAPEASTPPADVVRPSAASSATPPDIPPDAQLTPARPEAPPAPAPPAPLPPAARPTADEILRSVERGELGVEEALRLLDDRDRGPRSSV